MPADLVGQVSEVSGGCRLTPRPIAASISTYGAAMTDSTRLARVSWLPVSAEGILASRISDLTEPTHQGKKVQRSIRSRCRAHTLEQRLLRRAHLSRSRGVVGGRTDWRDAITFRTWEFR